MPTADKMRFYFGSRYLTADNDALTEQTADAGGTVKTIVDAALTQADDYWNGAIGRFEPDTTTVALRGAFFHVRDFDAASDTLTLAKSLPAAPVAGDTYRLIHGGKWRSAQECYGLTVGGDQPELFPVALATITGVTVKKASPRLGAGTVTLFYDQPEDLLTLKIGDGDYGVGLDVSGNLSDAIIFAADGQAYLQIDVTAASLPVGDEIEALTLAYPCATLTPDFEGYETLTGKKIRHRLVVVKNTDGAAAMIDAGVYVKPVDGTASALAAGETCAVTEDSFEVDDASDWPTKSFWLYNSTKTDCRYIMYRSGNTCYAAAANTWSKLAFDAGETEIAVGDTVTGDTSGATGVVAAVQVNSGSWGGSDAAGFLWLSDVTDDFDNDEDLLVLAATVAVADGADVKGLRDLTAAAWEAADVVEIMPDADAGLEAPSTLEFSDPAGESVAPAGVTFSAPATVEDALEIGDLDAGEIYGVRLREWIMDAHRARPEIYTDLTGKFN